MKKILLVTVNYQDCSPTEKLIESLGRCDASDLIQVVIVDSESKDTSQNGLEALIDQSPLDIKLFTASRNLYYWGGVAFGIQKLDLDYTQFPDWIIASNNDIVPETDFIKRLNELDPGRFSVIAPAIRSATTQKDLNPYAKQPLTNIDRAYYRLFHLHPISGRVVNWIGRRLNSRRKRWRIPTDKGIPMKIYAPHGSCIIFSRHFFHSGGFIDTGFRLFGEEISVAEMTRKMNYSVYYHPQLKVMHYEHSSMRKKSFREQFYQSQATYRYLKKQYL